MAGWLCYSEYFSTVPRYVIHASFQFYKYLFFSYDVFYNLMDESTRSTFRTALLQKGVEPIFTWLNNTLKYDPQFKPYHSAF